VSWEMVTFRLLTGLSGLFWLAILVGLALCAYGLLVSRPGTPVPAPAEDPLRILQLRYARGEIGRDEYMRMRQDLAGDGHPDAGGGQRP
jgi:uncharacterized membrane protein